MQLRKITTIVSAAVLTVAMSIVGFAGGFGVVGYAKAETEAEVKTADVFMIAGQSNAAGSTRKDSNSYGYEITYRPKENVLYYGGTHKTIEGGAGRYLRDFRPVQHGCGYTDNHVGFEIGMADVLNERDEYKGENKKAIIFKSAAGGTSVMPDKNYNNFGNWYPESLWEENYWDSSLYNNIVGFQYRVFIDEFKRFLEDAKAQGFEKINLKGLFWMQGESDRNNPDKYVDVCSALFKDFRAQFTKIIGEDCSSMPIYVGEISETFSSAVPTSIELNRNLIAAQHKIANLVPAVFVAELHDYAINAIEFGQNVVLGSDQSHWNYEDIFSIGKDFIALYDKVDGKVTGSVSVRYDGTKAAINKTTLKFDGEYGANFCDDTEVMPFTVKTGERYVIQSVEASSGSIELIEKTFNEGEITPVYKYNLTGMKADEVVTVTLGSNKKITVNISGEGEDYGSIPSQKTVEDAFVGCKYALETYPFSNGALYKFELNGHTVYGQKNVSKYIFDDWEQYVGEDNELNIKVFYGEKKEVNQKLDEIASGKNDDPETTGGCSCAGAGSSVLPLLSIIGAALVFLIKRRNTL